MTNNFSGIDIGMTRANLPPSPEIADSIKRFILTEVLPGEDPSLVTESTPLMSTAVLDSTSTLKLILYIEEQFGVELEARDTRPANLETIESIVKTIVSRSAKG
jgi:acyl carrier protein